MLGDDPNPTVTATRFEFGGVFGRAQEGGACLCREVKWFDKRETKNTVGLRTVNEGKGDAATTNGCKFYEKHADAMRMML